MKRRHVLFLLIAFVGAGCQPVTEPTLVAPETAPPSPKPSNTPSPSATATLPTATLGPAPRTFTQNFDGNLNYWSFVQVDNGSEAPDPQIKAGYLRFDLSAPNQWQYGIYGPQSYSDVQVEAQVSIGGTKGAAGVVCRYSQKGGWYELDVYPDQTYVLLYGQWLAPGVARYTPMVHSQSEKIGPDQNTIGLRCQGNILTPLINGVQMRQRQDNTFGLTTGQVGISVASFEDAPVAVLYEWVKVSLP